jgi:hypothetical protein
MNAWPGWSMNRDPAARPFLPPEVVVEVKALACELPAATGLPLSRLSRRDLTLVHPPVQASCLNQVEI